MLKLILLILIIFALYKFIMAIVCYIFFEKQLKSIKKTVKNINEIFIEDFYEKINNYQFDNINKLIIFITDIINTNFISVRDGFVKTYIQHSHEFLINEKTINEFYKCQFSFLFQNNELNFISNGDKIMLYFNDKLIINKEIINDRKYK